VTYTVSGTYTKNFPAGNAVGCDSTATLILTINHSSTSTTTITSCDSLVWNGVTYTVSGTYTATGFTNAAGCDSTATLILTINHSTTSTTTITECNSYLWNGITYTASGTYTKLFPGGNTSGCDSTAVLILTINSTSSTTNVTICSAQLPYVWNNNSYYETGTYTVTGFTNAAGCDSTATINLLVNITPSLSSSLTATATHNVQFTYTPTSTTDGTTFSWSRAAVTGVSNAAATGSGPLGIITETLLLDNPGGSAIDVKYIYTLTANGCSNDDTVIVTVNPPPPPPRTMLVTTIIKDQVKSADKSAISAIKLDIAAMPNPTTAYFNLVIKSDSDIPVTVRVLDIFGKVIEYHEKIAPVTSLRFGQGWAAGAYYAEVIQGGQRKVLKLMKTN
jgi:hypothetical protein